MLRPWNSQHDEFARRIDIQLTADPTNAPQPYEVEVE
jgi:hypothetical protein